MDADHYEACKPTDLTGAKAIIEMLTQNSLYTLGCGTLISSPTSSEWKLAVVVQFSVPGSKNGGSDKGQESNRVDSIPITNGAVSYHLPVLLWFV